MRVVLDTNVLVSALWSSNGAPAQLLGMIVHGTLTPCYDFRIMREYREVLQRPKFDFSLEEISALLSIIETAGFSVIAPSVGINFTDESDKKFYEVAKYCDALLITGNAKHFPEEPIVMSVRTFLDRYTV